MAPEKKAKGANLVRTGEKHVVKAGGKRGKNRGKTGGDKPPHPTQFKPGESGNPATMWKAGQSGNPGGRPKAVMGDALLEQVLREVGKGAGKKKIASLIANVLTTKALKGDLRAIIEVYDRVDGKAVQAHEVAGPGGGPIPYADLSREDKIRRLTELRAKAAADGKGRK